MEDLQRLHNSEIVKKMVLQYNTCLENPNPAKVIEPTNFVYFDVALGTFKKRKIKKMHVKNVVF